MLTKNEYSLTNLKIYKESNDLYSLKIQIDKTINDNHRNNFIQK